jgi:hypothetical protein
VGGRLQRVLATLSLALSQSVSLRRPLRKCPVQLPDVQHCRHLFGLPPTARWKALSHAIGLLLRRTRRRRYSYRRYSYRSAVSGSIRLARWPGIRYAPSAAVPTTNPNHCNRHSSSPFLSRTVRPENEHPSTPLLEQNAPNLQSINVLRVKTEWSGSCPFGGVVVAAFCVEAGGALGRCRRASRHGAARTYLALGARAWTLWYARTCSGFRLSLTATLTRSSS